MNHEERIEEIEPSLMMLDAAYAFSLLGMILWLVN